VDYLNEELNRLYNRLKDIGTPENEQELKIALGILKDTYRAAIKYGDNQMADLCKRKLRTYGITV
jgi:hypothetical protein